MNGFEFFNSIRSDAALKNIPVVVMSAFANEGMIPGADAFTGLGILGTSPLGKFWELNASSL